MALKIVLALSALVTTTTGFAQPPQASASASVSRGSVLLSGADLADVRSRKAEFATLLQRCAKEITYEARPISVLAPDPHYSSTGLNKSTNNAKQLAADSLAAYRLGLCYAITGNSKFAATAQRIIDSWAGTLKQVTNAQGKSGINFNLQYMIAAATWTRGINGWDGVAFGRFLRAVVLPNSTSSNDNNHGMWGTFLEASAAAYLGDAALLTKARDRWTAIFKGAASPDGTLIREIERSDTNNWHGGPTKGIRGLAYTHYFLLPASMAAKVFADQGQPVWTTDGGKLLQAAFGKAAAWTLHPETFPFYASNNGKLQDTRGVSYFPLLLRYYPNADAEAVLRQGDLGEGGFFLSNLFG